MAEREINFLREVVKQADAAADRLYPNLEQATGNFDLDMKGPAPIRDAIEALEHMSLGARLIIIASEKGLPLPNGELFKPEPSIDPDLLDTARGGTD